MHYGAIDGRASFHPSLLDPRTSMRNLFLLLPSRPTVSSSLHSHETNSKIDHYRVAVAPRGSIIVFDKTLPLRPTLPSSFPRYQAGGPWRRCGRMWLSTASTKTSPWRLWTATATTTRPLHLPSGAWSYRTSLPGHWTGPSPSLHLPSKSYRCHLLHPLLPTLKQSSIWTRVWSSSTL